MAERSKSDRAAGIYGEEQDTRRPGMGQKEHSLGL